MLCTWIQQCNEPSLILCENVKKHICDANLDRRGCIFSFFIFGFYKLSGDLINQAVEQIFVQKVKLIRK